MSLKKVYFTLHLFAWSMVSNAQFAVEASNSITVIREGGSTITNPWTGGINSVQLSMYDADFDGQEDDIFIFDRQGNRTLVFQGNTQNNSLTYEYKPSSYRESFPQMVNFALLRDYNCDGNRDLFTYSSFGGAMTVYRNSGGGPTPTWELESEALLSLFDFGSTEFETNIYTSSQDIPALFDYEGDGDLDILSFNVGGSFLELHLNNSVDNDGQCDLSYYLANRCYGGFIEGEDNNDINLNPDDFADVCVFNVPNPKNGGLRHVGSTILTFDGNNDGLHDLVLGDVGFENLVYLENSNQGANSPDQVVDFDTAFPSNMGDEAVSINNFPAAFYEDVSGDGVSDLLVSVNATEGAKSYESLQLFSNEGFESSPDFLFESSSFLQNDMLDWGRNANPTLSDLNGDNLIDLVVGASYESGAENTLVPRLVRLENIGTASEPSFQVVDSDWLNISETLTTTNPSPVLADFDQDGDLDLILGMSNGSLHYFENNNGYSYTGLLDLSGSNDAVGSAAIPSTFDMNGDGFPDLIVGESAGNLNYFENNAAAGAPSFSLITEELGGVNTTISPPFFEGRSAPAFFEFEGEALICVGSKSGILQTYEIGDATDTWSLLPDVLDVYSSFNSSPLGLNSRPALGDLNGDGFPEAICGITTGGLELFMGTGYLSSRDQMSELGAIAKIYPNPSEGQINLDYLKDTTNYQMFIHTIDGRLVFQTNVFKKRYDLFHLEPGIYLISLNSDRANQTVKWIKK
jgi:hypothetical protein